MIMNMNEKGRQTKLLAAIAVLAMVVCALAVIVPADDASATPGTPSGGSVTIKTAGDLTEVLAGISADGEYKGVDTIILTSDITIPTSLTIDKNVTIISEEGHNYTITLGSRMIVSSNVTFEDLTISTTMKGNMIFTVYKARSLGEDVTLTFNNVVFDESTNTKKIIVDSDLNSATSHLVMNGCTTSGVSISYSKTTVSPTVEIINSAGLGLELFDKTGNGKISIGTDITTDSALGDVSIEVGTVSVEKDVTINTITNDGELSVSSKLTVNSGNISGTGSTIKTTSNAEIVDPEGDPIDVTTIVTDSDLTDAFANNDVVIYGGSVSNATITIPELKTGQELRFPNNSVSGANIIIVINGQTAAILGSSGDGTKFNAKGFYITSGSVKINAEEMNGPIYSGTEVVDISGKLTGNVTLGSLPVGKNSFVVPSNEKLDLNGNSLTIQNGVSLTAYGPIVDDSDMAGTITNNGILQFTSIDNGITLTGSGLFQVTGGFGVENTIRTDLTLEGTNNYLRENTTIEAGVTLTLDRNAVLDLMGNQLIIKGNLVLERGATIISTEPSSGISEICTGGLQLMSTGSITNNNGVIGTTKAIKISNGETSTSTDGEQYVAVKGISGINISLVRSLDTDGVRVYDMAVSGDVSKISKAVNPSLTVMNVNINADMSIGSDVYFTIEEDGVVTVGKDVTFTHDGLFMKVDGTFVLSNGSSAIINAPASGIIKVPIGQISSGDDFKTPGVNATVTLSGKYTKATNDADAYSEGVTGITISVDRASIPNKETGKSDVYQRMYVSGTLEVQAEDDINGADTFDNIKFSNAVYVSGTLYIDENVNVDNTTIDNYYFDLAEGAITTETDMPLKYSGAYYIVETTGTDGKKTETYHYTSFASAIEQIGTALNGEITIAGDFEITGTFQIADDQSITFDDDAYGTADYKDNIVVAETGSITVAEDGNIDADAFMKIYGKVTALAGSGYEPAEGAGIYAVVTIDEETDDTTYSGFKIALDNATAGQTVTVVDTAEYDGNLVIPNGVTVDVDPNVVLSVTGNVTVETGGKLILDNRATLNVGKTGRDSTVTVAGELDASEGGSITAFVDPEDPTKAAKSVNIYSTGKSTFSPSNTFAGVVKMNAVYYQDGEIVYTSLANAIAYAEENALTQVNAVGTFSEAGEVESDGIDIIIDNGAKVTFGTIILNNASIAPAENADVEYTATVSGLAGAGDAAITSTISVTKTGATIESSAILNAEGVTEYSLTINAIDGNTNVSTGTVTYIGSEDIIVNRNNVLTVSSGATLIIDENVNVDIYSTTINDIDGIDCLVIEGTVQIDGTVTAYGVIIPGNIVVSEDGILNIGSTENDYPVCISGTLSVDADGMFHVYSYVLLGEIPEYLGDTAIGSIEGEVILEAGSYIMVFDGASVVGATITNAVDADAVSTAFNINGIGYATVYTTDSNLNMGYTPVEEIIYSNLDDLATIDSNNNPIDIKWYSGETEVTTVIIGDYAELNTEIAYADIGIVMSVTPHVTMSIDNVVRDVVSGNTYNLTIGTHTVNAVVDAGFTGDVVITFNGQTIQNGGTIEVTADMAGQNIVLSVSGNITQDSTVVIDGGSSSDSGLGLTDYLLIVLVILIVVMAIIVALRLMRS